MTAANVLLIDEVAEITRLSPATLRTMRHHNRGPRSFKIGRRIAYYPADVHEWIERQRQHTTRGGDAP